MKNTKVLDVLKAIQGWYCDGKPISELCQLLGDNDYEIASLLAVNGLADFAYKPIEGFCYQDVVNVVLLYLAMRGEIRKKAKHR